MTTPTQQNTSLEKKKDILFYNQVYILGQDFKVIQALNKQTRRAYFPIPVDQESPLTTGAILVLNMNHEQLNDYCHNLTITDNVHLEHFTYPDIILANLRRDCDRARVFVNDNLMFDTILHFDYNVKASVCAKFGVKNIDHDLYTKALGEAKKDSKESTRITTALLTSIGLGLPVIISSKTVRPQKDYDVAMMVLDGSGRRMCFSRLGTGRVALSGENGIEREVFLEIRPKAEPDKIFHKIKSYNKVYPVAFVERRYKYDENTRCVKMTGERLISKADIDSWRR